MNQEGIGKSLFAVGIALCLTGVLIWKFGDRIKGFGHLPGDFTYEGEQFKFYFPVTTLLLLNAAFWLILKIKDWLSRL